ncbi:hypothetical protein Bbelb_146660 [Branchiostoma belcheri]|nr:hypothetical protein Bbelb_146660 [Branchiostoma belcheri]
MSAPRTTTLWTATSTDALDETTQVFTEMTSTQSEFPTDDNVTTLPTTVVSQSQTTANYTEMSSVTESTFMSTPMPTTISSVTTTPRATSISKPCRCTSTPTTCQASNVNMIILGTAVGSIIATCVMCAVIFLVWYKFYHIKKHACGGNDNDSHSHTEETNLGTRASADDIASPQRARDSEARPPAPLPRSELQDVRYLTMSDMRSASAPASPRDIELRETVGTVR